MKINNFMDIFQVSDHLLCMGPPLYGWWETFLGRSAWTQGGSTPLKQNSLSKIGWSLPREGRPHPKRVVTDFKNLHENINFYFYSTSMFVEYLGQKIILEFSLGHFQICMNRAVEKCAKILF